MTKRVSLTFDNGPTPGITEHVLDTLELYGITATFFLVGETLDDPVRRALAERARADGHRIGNHSFSHGEPLGLHTEPGTAAAEILRGQAALGDLATDPVLYRPNGRGKMGEHLLNAEALETLIDLEASVVLWNSVPRDRAVVVDAPDIWLTDARAAIAAHDWTVMVLHDRPSGFPAPGPMAHLPDFLRWAMDHVTFVDAFPAECTPLIGGHVQPGMDRYVSR